MLWVGRPQSEQDPWERQEMGKAWAGPATGKAGWAAARLLPGQVKCGSHGKAAGPVDGTGKKRYQEAAGQGRDRWSRVNSKKKKKINRNQGSRRGTTCLMTPQNKSPHFLSSISHRSYETEPSFSIPDVHSPAPASGSVLCTEPLAFCCFGPFSHSPSQDCSRAPGFLSYHSVCFHGVTIQINRIIIKINKDFFLQTRKALSVLAAPGTEGGWGTQGMGFGARPLDIFSCQVVMGRLHTK